MFARITLMKSSSYVISRLKSEMLPEFIMIHQIVCCCIKSYAKYCAKSCNMKRGNRFCNNPICNKTMRKTLFPLIWKCFSSKSLLKFRLAFEGFVIIIFGLRSISFYNNLQNQILLNSNCFPIAQSMEYLEYGIT